MPPPAAGYTRGPIGRVMVSTAFSMLAGTLAISGYNIVDTYFVARLGKLPLAAMGFTFPVVMLVGCVYNGLGGGVMTPVAQLLGGGRREQAARMVTSGALLITLTGVLMGVAGCLSLDFIFIRLGATPEVLPMVRSYMVIWYLGSLTGALAMSGNHLLVAAGAPKTAGLMMMGGMVLNAVLDPFFIFGWWFFPELGIAGAALATVVSQLISLLALAAILHWRLRLIAPFSAIPYPRLFRAWRVIARYGIPAMLGMVLNPVGMAVVTKAVAVTGGDTAVAATAAAGRLEAVAFIFPMSLGMSLLPMVGQNYGARAYDRIDRCRRFSMRFAGGFLLLMSVVYYVLAEPLSRVFSSDPEVVATMVRYVRITTWGFAFIEIHRYSTFFFTGSGHPTAAAALNVLRIIGFMVPLTLLALWQDSLDGVFYARLAADMAAGIIGCTLAKLLTRHLLRRTES